MNTAIDGMEGKKMRKKALMTASVASMIGLFNMENIHILQNMGYQVDVAANFEFGNNASQEWVKELQENLEEIGVRMFHIPVPRSIGDFKHIILSYRQIKSLCQRENYHLIHTQTPIGGVITRLAAKNVRKKGTTVIYAAHGFHFFRGAPVKNWLLFYTVEKLVSKYTDILITINREDYHAAKTFYSKKVCYLPGVGIDLKKYQEEPGDAGGLRRSLGLKESDFVLISVGELSKRKNQEVLIRAMAKIPDDNVKYVIVGMGELEKVYRSLIKELHLQKRVVLVGYREDIPELLQMSDVFVFPSLQEGLPASVMEAMAAGLPIVCGRIRGNTDLVTDGKEGILVDPRDSQAFAKAIMEIRENPDKGAVYGENAKKKIQGFCVEVVNEKMRKIYENVYK